MHHFAFVVRHVEQNAAVRIGPDPLGHGPLQSDFFLRFVGNTSSVMCEKRSVHHHKAHDERQRHYERKPHKPPPQRISNTERPDTAISHAVSSGLLTIAAIAYLQNYFGSLGQHRARVARSPASGDQKVVQEMEISKSYLSAA